MKKTAAILLLAGILCLSLFSCSSGKPAENGGGSPSDPSPSGNAAEAEKDVDLDALVGSICDKYGLTEGFIFTSSSEELGEYLDADLIQSYYGDASDMPDFDKVSSYCLYVDESDPNIIIDVGVFRMADVSYADTFMQYLQSRIDVKIENGARYTNIDVATLKKSVVSKSGSYVYYVVSYDTADIVAELKAALGK